jgi:hypothetical protein
MDELYACFPLVLAILYLGVIVYLITLAARFVVAVERIADKFERGSS